MSAATPVDILMPQMGVAVTEGTVVAWHVAVGDEIAVDQPVCDIATDKVDTEVLATAAGVVAEIVVPEGETVAVGEPVLRLATDGTVSAPEPVAAAGAETPVQAAAVASNGTPLRVGHASEVLAGASIDTAAAADASLDRPNANGAPLSSPVARRLATRHGLDLADVRGSGRRGRICKADVLAAAAQAATDQPKAPAPAAAQATPAPAPVPGPDGIPRGYEDVPYEVVATSHQRRAISEHMIRSRQTAAHMTTESEVDMHRVSEVRKEINVARAAAGETRVSFLSFIARAAIAALADFPDLNATFEHERSIRWREVNLGIAVDTPGGLIVPVIRGAERLTVGAIADAIADVGERGRTRKLVPDDLRAGTFTISNPGSVGAVSAPAIINQPQVAILGTPAIVKRPWVVATADGGEAIVPRPIMKLALTFDHRAIDGADATRYVVRVKDHLETWDAQAYL
jgi:2-oxoglutarate dehydrogenase E2 component (dihydrolipoamide succinyltransferase)